MWKKDEILNMPHYKVGAKVFASKVMASIESKNTNQKMTWHYYDHVWKPLNIEDINYPNLDEVYKSRAIQLREKYDYIVLNYSGGVDSWNILRTFLVNKIKLDQITVRFPWDFLNKKLHNPNRYDIRESNRFSEWDYTIKPDLEYIALKHPDIFIHFEDWLPKEKESIILTDNIFEEIHCQYGFGSVLRGMGHEPSVMEKEQMDKGKSVGTISGVDKPKLLVRENKMYYYFADSPIGSSPPRYYKLSERAMEYFYWGHENPNVLYSQIKVLYNWFKNNKEFLWCINEFSTNSWRSYANITKSLIYPKWNHKRFQCEKPSFGVVNRMRPADVQFETHPEIAPIREKYEYLRKDYDKLLNPEHLFKNGEFKRCITNPIYVGDI